MIRLERGDLLPEIVTLPPGPHSRRYSERLAAAEAPGINTLVGDAPSLLWSEALGANILDVDGNVFVDLTAGFGVAAIGHRHARVVAAIAHQASRLVHGLGDVHAHPTRVELAERLGEWSPIRDPRVYFAISGADAVEISLKTALLHSGRAGIVAFDPGYHGTTLGALAVSSRRAFRAPFDRQLHQRVERIPFGCSPATLDGVLRSGDHGAVIVEPVVGREGVCLPPRGWLAEIAHVCTRHRVPWIADEIFTGFGRTGHRFAVDSEGVIPDLLCCGKALGGGLPIAAVIGNAETMASWHTEGEALHTATFVGHPLACAAALATLDVLEQERLTERAQVMGKQIAQRRSDIESHTGVVELRGRGLIWGIELDHPGRAKRLVQGLLRCGVLALAGGAQGTVLQIAPPLVITEEQLGHALDAVQHLLARGSEGSSS